MCLRAGDGCSRHIPLSLGSWSRDGGRCRHGHVFRGSSLSPRGECRQVPEEDGVRGLWWEACSQVSRCMRSQTSFLGLPHLGLQPRCARLHGWCRRSARGGQRTHHRPRRQTSGRCGCSLSCGWHRVSPPSGQCMLRSWPRLRLRPDLLWQESRMRLSISGRGQGIRRELHLKSGRQPCRDVLLIRILMWRDKFS